MNQTEIIDKVIEIVNSVVNMTVTVDNMDMRLSSIGFNSLLFMKLLIRVENIFDIEFDEEDIRLSNFIYVYDIAAFIDEKICKQEGEI